MSSFRTRTNNPTPRVGGAKAKTNVRKILDTTFGTE
jgi:hypothetical protein